MFIPSSNNPAELDQAMRANLADSLHYIHTTVMAVVNLPTPEVAAAISTIRARRVSPGIFGRYFKLVMSIEARDYALARGLFLEIIDLVRHVPSFSAFIYSEGALGAEKRLYGDLVNPDRGATPWIAAPDADGDFAQRVHDALALIAVADRGLADELRGLIIQVVGAVPSGAPGVMSFGSVSSFMLWGLVIVNMERYPTAVDLVQGLTHEAAHLLLYAYSLKEPLVTNPIDERYMSPLRSDPRPMDGIIHATFVTARLHYLNARIREATSASFAPVPLDELNERLEMFRGLYYGGVKTLRDHGKLTATGQHVLEASLDYMKAA